MISNPTSHLKWDYPENQIWSARALSSQVSNTSEDGDPTSTILCGFLGVHSESPEQQPLVVVTFHTICHDQEEFGFIVFVIPFQVDLGSYYISEAPGP